MTLVYPKNQARQLRQPPKKLPFRKSRLAGALAGVLGYALTNPAFAVGIGEITLTSALNAPLSGTLSVTLDQGEVIHQDELTIKLASRDAHQEAGLPYPRMLRRLQIIEERQTGRSIEFSLSSPEPIYEPIISLILELEWDQGNLQKEITLLLDPVGYTPVRSISPENSNLLQPGDYIGAEPPSTSPENTASHLPIFVSGDEEPIVQVDVRDETPRPLRSITFNKGEYGPVKSGDTLSAIAVAAARQVGIDTTSMVELIYDANPEAFINSPDTLIKGAMLQIPGLLPELQDVKAVSRQQAQPINPEPVVERPATNRPLLTIVGSEDEASRVLPSDEQAPTGSLTQAGEGDSTKTSAPSEGNNKLEEALLRIQDLELKNQTLANENFALENNLSHTQEQLGNVRNELDRLVVELKVLSQIQQESQTKDPDFISQIEKWLPWLLLFLTLPMALFLGLRNRREETVVYAPPAPQETGLPDSTLTGLETDEPLKQQPQETNFDSVSHRRANPADSQVIQLDEEPVTFIDESEGDEFELNETLTNEELISEADSHAQSLLDDDVDEEYEHQLGTDPLAETVPGLVISRENQETLEQYSDETALENEPEDTDTAAAAEPERRLQSLPTEGDTQEVIRSTLNKLEATQLISPGESPKEPEQSLDATQEAEIYIAYDQFSLAEKTIDRLLANDPNNDKYQLLQLKLFSETGNMEELQNLSVKMLHKHPDPDSEVNQRIRAICDKAFTETNLKRADLAKPDMDPFLAENIDNETILEDMTAETLFVDGVEDYISSETLSDEDELQTGLSLDATAVGYDNDFDTALENLTEESLGSLTRELPPHLLEDRDKTEVFDERSGSITQALMEDREETLSEGLELPFDLESEIAKYESELENELGKRG